MSTTKIVYRADEFPVGAVLSVHGISDYQAFTVDAITFSAVHITKSDGSHGTISCGTPCVEFVKKIVEPIIPTEKKEKIIVKEIKIVQPTVEEKETENVGTGQRGRPQGIQGKIIADKLAAFVFPEKPFTMKQLSQLTGIDPLNLLSYVQKNCECIGEEEKIEGKRGRLSKLYLHKK